jgi:nitric oxide reductase NorD protein
MAEAEGLLIEGARRAAVAARELWWRGRAPGARREVPLARVKRRLELVVTALAGETYPIVPSDPPPPPTWLARALGRAPRHLAAGGAAATDGATIWLPRALPAEEGEAAAVETYRLLAVQQAARVVRGTASRRGRDRLEHDLYLLAEGVAVDRALARDLGGLVADLRAARAAALEARPALERLGALERAVEDFVRAALAADPFEPPAAVPAGATPGDSLRWARATAARLRAAPAARLRAAPAARLRSAASTRYRGVAPVPLWGETLAPPDDPRIDSRYVDDETPLEPVRAATLPRRPRVRQAADGEDDDRPGTWMIRPDEPLESVEDPMGMQRPADRDEQADAAELADSLSELPEARVVQTPGTPREVLDSDAAPAARAPARTGRDVTDAGIAYPEWDFRLAAYRERAAIVRPGVVPAGPAAWVDGVMARHAALVRRVRRRFDGLRPRRTPMGRQADGPDLDLSAYVAAFADWRSSQPGDDRFYAAARPARRDLAIALLVDVSASTDGWVSGPQRIIDVEKESLIVLLEALDALGDRHAALAFSGEGPGHVRVLTIKGFDEPAGPAVRRRVAALEPDRYTRVGAAIRHTSALLAHQPARHHLLLVLSDGKPNDVDGYEGRYGIADTRQAVAEARVQGLVPFCLTVDREAPAYMPSIFGRSHAVLRRQDLLPGVLVEVVRRLLMA